MQTGTCVTKLDKVCLASNPEGAATRKDGRERERLVEWSSVDRQTMFSAGLPEKAGKKMLGVQITSLTCELFDVELELGIIILFEVIFSIAN